MSWSSARGRSSCSAAVRRGHHVPARRPRCIAEDRQRAMSSMGCSSPCPYESPGRWTSPTPSSRARSMAAQLHLGDEAMSTAHDRRGAARPAFDAPRTRIEVALAARWRRSCPPGSHPSSDHERDPQDGVRRARRSFVARTLPACSSTWRYLVQRPPVPAGGVRTAPAPEADHAGVVTRPTCDQRRRPASRRRPLDRWVSAALPRQRPTQSRFERDMLDPLIGVDAGCPSPNPSTRRPRHGDVVHLDIAWPDLLLADRARHTFWHGGVARDAGGHGPRPRL